MILLLLLLSTGAAADPRRGLCAACRAVVEETLRELGDSRREMDVDEAVDGVCALRRLNHYDFPPPDMRDFCRRFMAKHSEALVEQLMRRADNAGAARELCHVRLALCADGPPSDNL